jgi:hypothetical protein
MKLKELKEKRENLFLKIWVQIKKESMPVKHPI